MLGAVGRPGAGLCPVRGHSNVQGDRTMGITARPEAAFLDALARRFGFAPPRASGLDTVGAIEAMRDGRVRVVVGLGGNLLSASPDTHATAAALARCELTAYVSTKLNRGHLVPGRAALMLPCLGRSERDARAGGPAFVTVEDSMGCVHRSQGVLAPASPELRSEVDIVAALGEAVLGPETPVAWRALAADYDLIREHIAGVVPGFADFNARVRAPAGFVLPNAARERRFATTTGRARFVIHPLPPRRVGPGQLLLTTIRSHDQYNTTIYGLDDRYRGIHGGRRVVFVNRDDLAARGLASGALVDLDQPVPGRDPRRAPLPCRRVRHTARLGGGVFSGGQPAGPARSARARQSNARLEVGRDRASAQRRARSSHRASRLSHCRPAGSTRRAGARR